MKKTFTLLLIMLVLGLCSVLDAQTALDPGEFVNGQITGPGIYTVEAGQAYAFDGRIDLDFEITIQGPDNGWIMDTENPPVLIQSPATDGSARDFFEVKEGGGLTLKNVLFTGTMNNGEVVEVIARNTGGSKMIVDNCVITDWLNFAFRNSIKGDSISVTNSVFLNGVRLSFSQWGGFPMRMDVACDNVVWENNTIVNSARLLANSGPFQNADISQMHNTYINQCVAGEEQRANEFMIANNIFYNFHFLGRTTENHSSPDNTYGSYFTTWNYYADSKNSLDSISLYLGQNLFYRPPSVVDWFEANGGDSLALSLFWEHPDVDSFIIDDDNYRIGANYAEMDPDFTQHPGNTEAVVDFIESHRIDRSDEDEWADWRIASPVSYDGGTPILSWPPAFDLSYSNTFLQTAGTDGLPLGDLNWFPDKKEEFLANREAIMESIRDSMLNAVVFYNPETMDSTPFITEGMSSSVFEQLLPADLYLTGNYPNPFDQNTTIKFALHEQAKVTLSVFNLVGQKIFESLEQRMSSGPNEINFDASGLSSGVYLYKISVNDVKGQNYILAEEMIVTK